MRGSYKRAFGSRETDFSRCCLKISYKWVELRSFAHPITKKVANAKDPTIRKALVEKRGDVPQEQEYFFNDNKRMAMLRLRTYSVERNWS